MHSTTLAQRNRFPCPVHNNIETNVWFRCTECTHNTHKYIYSFGSTTDWWGGRTHQSVVDRTIFWKPDVSPDLGDGDCAKGTVSLRHPYAWFPNVFSAATIDAVDSAVLFKFRFTKYNQNEIDNIKTKFAFCVLIVCSSPTIKIWIVDGYIFNT
jgi:hypothetical protein